MGRRVLMSGFAPPSKEWVNYQPSGVEIWAMNEGHLYLAPHALEATTLWFQVHPRDWKEERKRKLGVESKIPPNTFARGDDHIAFLKTLKVPLLSHPTLSPWPDLPTSIPFPLKEVAERYGIEGRAYLTSTPAYMLAYLLLEDDRAREAGDESRRVTELRISGIELKVGKEFWAERPCFEYYLGRIAERGIKIVPPPSGFSLLNAPVYAVDITDVTLSTEIMVTPERVEPKPIYRPDFKDAPRVHVLPPDVEARLLEEQNANRAKAESAKAGLPEGGHLPAGDKPV